VDIFTFGRGSQLGVSRNCSLTKEHEVNIMLHAYEDSEARLQDAETHGQLYIPVIYNDMMYIISQNLQSQQPTILLDAEFEKSWGWSQSTSSTLPLREKYGEAG